MLRCSLVLPFYILLSACSVGIEGTGNNQQQDNLLEIEKKYYLKDCIVKVNLLWGNGFPIDKKYEAVRRMIELMKIAVVSGDFPFFSGGTTRNASYITVYYSDRCEDRVSMTDRLIQDYLLPEEENFPEVSIETDVVPAFDGSLPSGWWLDD